MKFKKLSLDDFRPLVEAMEEQPSAETDYYEKLSAARELLNRIKSRQSEDAEKVNSMLDALSKEETSLRKEVRENASNRARALLAGQQPPETDSNAGARLAAIPDERAALEALRESREMTAEEPEEWVRLHDEVSGAAKRLEKVNGDIIAELVKWACFFPDGRKNAVMSKDSTDLFSLEEDARNLNNNESCIEYGAVFDDYEPLEDEGEDKDSKDWSRAYSTSWLEAFGRKAD